MPPKSALGTARPQHARKPSTSKTTADRDPAAAKERNIGKGKEKEKERGKKETQGTMLPPPPPPKSMAILEPELDALEDSLKNTVITAAQVFSFYTETKRLGVQGHAVHPPRSMTSVLEYEIGRYDQICDAMEAHLNRAIAVLQRDLEREENRIREEEAEKARAKAAEASKADSDIKMANDAGPSSENDTKSQRAAPSGALAGTGKIPLRRPSKISLSTLQRNPFPLKLDLSSASLRLGTDEGGLDMAALSNLSGLGTLGPMGVDSISGLPSPVTLAPKSARPMGPGELPPDVLAALASASGVGNQNMQLPSPSQQVDIDLTLEDHSLQMSANMGLADAGDSADKPIELDLDLDAHMPDLSSDIFGEHSGDATRQSGPSEGTNLDSLFGPDSGTTEAAINGPISEMDMSILLSENQSHDDAIFASLNSENDGSRESATGTQAGHGSASNEVAGPELDYSLFFNNAPNQENIDIMEQFLKMDGDSTGGAGESSGSGFNSEVAGRSSAPT